MPRSDKLRLVGAATLAAAATTGGCGGGWRGGWFLAPVGSDDCVPVSPRYGTAATGSFSFSPSSIEEAIFLGVFVGIALAVEIARDLAEGCGDWVAHRCSGI